MTSALEPLWIGVDVGGTKVLAGVVDESGHVIRTSRRATPGRRVDIAQVEDALESAVLEAADGAPIAGVGVAVAGGAGSSTPPATRSCASPVRAWGSSRRCWRRPRAATRTG